MRRQHLVIMVKSPQAGRAKARLAAAIGAVEALRCYRVVLGQTVRRLAPDRRWVTTLAVTPDQAVGAIADWASAISPVRMMPQGHGGLGERMQRVMDHMPPGPVVIVGSDIPSLGRMDVAASFQALGDSDAVLGPAEDGGYWLVGQRRMPRILRLFDNVRWSSPHTLDDTLANLKGRKAAQLRRMADIDGQADYLRWRRGGLGFAACPSEAQSEHLHQPKPVMPAKAGIP